MWIQSNWFISRSNISRQHKPKKKSEKTSAFSQWKHEIVDLYPNSTN